MKKALLFGMLFCWALAGLSQATVTHNLTMWTTGQHMLHDGSMVRYYGFGPGFLVAPVFPGPTLYANEGDTVIVNVRNQSQRAPHTIHWHGLDVDQANDGVPSTSFQIFHLQDTNYTFIAPHAGTYLYHCHVASVIHVQMGMYGNFVVRPAGGGNQAWTGGPSFDKEYNWLMSEFDKSWHDMVPAHDSTDTAFAYFAVPPYIPDYFMVNGKSKSDLGDSTIGIAAKVGEKVYLRLSNVGFTMNKVAFPASLNAQVISSDGRKLPVALSQDTLWLTPGERYGVMLSPSVEFDDSISVSYVNMDNYQVWEVERVPVAVHGFVGINPGETRELGAEIFPNPNEGKFSIRLLSEKKTSLVNFKLFDAAGKEIHSEIWRNAAPSVVHEINVPGIPSGIYTVELTADGKRFVRPVVVSR